MYFPKNPNIHALGMLPVDAPVPIELLDRFHMSLPKCANCGYDLRATPDRCPECDALPKGRAGA